VLEWHENRMPWEEKLDLLGDKTKTGHTYLKYHVSLRKLLEDRINYKTTHC